MAVKAITTSMLVLLLALAGPGAAVRKGATMVPTLTGLLEEHLVKLPPTYGKILSSLEQATPQVAEMLYNVTQMLEKEIQERIRTGHHETQLEVLERLQQLQNTTANLVQAESQATVLDSSWVACVDVEKANAVAAEVSLSALQQRAGEEELARNAEELARPFVSDAPLNERFGCSESRAGGECEVDFEAYKKKWTDWLDRVEGNVTTHVNAYVVAESACLEAIWATGNQSQNLSAAQLAWGTKQGQCQVLDAQREGAMCLFGEKLHEKCRDKEEYESLKDDVNGTGTLHSEPDRIEEWKAADVVRCILQNYIDTGSLPAQECKEQVDYARDVGMVDLHSENFTVLTQGANYACTEETVTFNGTSWTVQPGSNASSDYVFLENWSPSVNLEPGEKAFNFCPI